MSQGEAAHWAEIQALLTLAPRVVPSRAGEQAEALAAGVPELSLRTEAAHPEAFVHLGPGGETSPAQCQLVWESLRTWSEEHRAQPSDIGTRVTFRSTGPLPLPAGLTATSRCRS